LLQDLGSNIKYTPIAANLVLYNIILSLYFFFIKLCKKSIKKLIVTIIIITNIIANFIKCYSIGGKRWKVAMELGGPGVT